MGRWDKVPIIVLGAILLQGAATEVQATIFNGTESDDIFISDSPSDDYYFLLDGNDSVQSETAGNDTYVGGLGNDLFYDLLGQDTYVFNIGDSNDTIYDMDGEDTIAFEAGITKHNIKCERSNDDVICVFR